MLEREGRPNVGSAKGMGVAPGHDPGSTPAVSDYAAAPLAGICAVKCWNKLF